MKTTTTKLFKLFSVIFTLFLLLASLTACGEETETETVDAPAAEKSESSAPRYTHPSGAFSILPFGEVSDEGEDYVVFSSADGRVIITFGEVDQPLDEQNAWEYAEAVLNSTLVENQFTSSYSFTTDEAQEVNQGYLFPFECSQTELGEEVGELYLTQHQQVLYVAILLAADYSSASEAWMASVTNFSVGPATAAQAPTQPAQEQTQNQQPASGQITNGFDPQLDGFGFENYGEGVTNLTAVEMQRMFGDVVCTSLSGGQCTLSPPAREWMSQVNQSMNGGHCEGMAVLSALMYHDQSEPHMFGANATNDLSLSNEDLQREIAYWFTTQYTSPGGIMKVNQSPKAVVETLLEILNAGKNAPEYFVMGIYKPDFSGGHAITPFGVEELGDGKYQILVYDNNWPNETRYVQVDTRANTWSYEASVNPQVDTDTYEGDAQTQTLEIVAVTPRQETQECTFCDVSSFTMGRGAGLAAPPAQYYEIWLEGDANLIIVNEAGQRTGYVDGKYINEIPGASLQRVKLGIEVWGSDYEPVYQVPVGPYYEIIVDGSDLTEAGTSDVSVIGPGYFLAIDDVWLEPDEQDTIGIYIDGSRHQITYMTDYEESPDITIGVETPEADFAFWVQATELVGAEDTFDVAIDLAEGDFILNTSNNTDPSYYDIAVLRIDDDGEHIFYYEDLLMNPNNTVYLNYLTWQLDGTVMYIDFDYENDGAIDESVELEDMGDIFEW